MSHSPFVRPGLTLIELVVVLAILAVLATVAVRSLEPIAAQARYEATQRTLTNVNDALLLRSFTPDRVASYSGFVADLGRLPIAIGSTSETQLAELWEQGTLPSFSITSFDDPDTLVVETIPVASGWRGPYLVLPPGPSRLRDGFGRAYSIRNASNTVASSGDQIANVVSAGANGTIDPTDDEYNRDIELPGGIWTNGRYQGSINVTVKQSDGISDPSLLSGQSLRLRLYGPENGVSSLFR